MSRQTGYADCPTCHVTHECEREEDGLDFELKRCQGAEGDTCLKLLCESCLVECRDCGLPVCLDHLMHVNGRPTCANCVAEEAKDGGHHLGEAA